MNVIRKLTRVLPDELYIKMKYRIRMGKKINLNDPKTYNEKLQWLKLHDRNPLYTTLVDKYEVKSYIAEIIGEEYVIPTLGVWERFEDIDFDSLPSQFVLKCTHDSGGLVICKDKKTFDIEEARRKITCCQGTNYYWHGREWPYKYVKPRIIAEQYMEDEKTQELRDYKFFAFNGTVRALFVASERQEKGTETKFDFFDADFNHLAFTNGHPNSTRIIEKPSSFEEMKELASILSKGFPQIRVDFYDVNGHVYFGELTFSHWSGFTPFSPEKWDEIFGSWIDLSLVKMGK